MAQHILVVDDDALMRRSTGLQLEQAGYRTSTASSAEDALALARRDPPDLERWGVIVKEWVGNGWNPTNVRGMLDKFQGVSKDGVSGMENGRKVIMVS